MTTAQKAYNYIREHMVAGMFLPGDRLREEHLAGEIGVSRTPVRQAIHMLEGEGLVELKPNGGAKFRVPKSREAENLYELRRLIDCAVARQAAPRMRPQDLEAMRASVRRMREIAAELKTMAKPDFDESRRAAWLRADLEFHRAIARSAANPEAMRLSENLQILVQNFIFTTMSTAEQLQPRVEVICADHEKILSAFAAADAERAAFEISTSMDRYRPTSGDLPAKKKPPAKNGRRR